MKDPREFSCMDDSPFNNGWGWHRWPDAEDIEWEEVEESIDNENETDYDEQQ